jgi:hypothetical protein
VKKEKKVNSLKMEDPKDSQESEEGEEVMSDKYDEEESSRDEHGYSTYEDSDEYCGSINVIRINSFKVSQTPKKRATIRPHKPVNNKEDKDTTQDGQPHDPIKTIHLLSTNDFKKLLNQDVPRRAGPVIIQMKDFDYNGIGLKNRMDPEYRRDLVHISTIMPTESDDPIPASECIDIQPRDIMLMANNIHQESKYREVLNWDNKGLLLDVSILILTDYDPRFVSIMLIKMIIKYARLSVTRLLI